MSDTFSLKIIAADNVLYEAPAVSLTIPATDGSLQILAHHENMIVANIPGDIKVVSSENEAKSAVVGAGYVRIISNLVTMVVASAEWKE